MHPSYQILQWLLRFTFSYVQPVTQRYRRQTVEDVPLQQSSHHENMTIRMSPTINYCLESAAAIMLRFQLFLVCYTALQTKNSVRIASAINPVTMENTDGCLQTYCREDMKCTILCYHESTPWDVSKKKWDTKEDKSKSMMCTMHVLWYAKRHVLG